MDNRNAADCIRLVLFDFDGTLTRPGALDFAAIRETVGCPERMPILEYIQGIADAARRDQARDTLDRFEALGAADSHPNEGAELLVHWLKKQGLMVGIITRNTRDAVLRALRNFCGLGAADFDLILTRDDPVAPKPSGEGILFAARHLGIDTQEVLVVGDFIFDVQAGRAAGARTVLLDPGKDPRLAEVDCDYRIRRLEALRLIVPAMR
jgi:hydrogenase expression/formation protein HypE